MESLTTEQECDNCASYKRDALRYRWLRDGHAYSPEECGVTGGEDLDAHCDAGITEAQIPPRVPRPSFERACPECGSMFTVDDTFGDRAYAGHAANLPDHVCARCFNAFLRSVAAA